MASAAPTPVTPAAPSAATDKSLYRALAASNAAARPLSLYVHLPFCRPANSGSEPRIVTANSAQIEFYLSRLDQEMRLLTRHLDTARPVEQLYWGGETPALLSLKQMGDLFDRLDARFGLSTAPERDYAIKLDPREADVFTLRHLQLLGFNRLSLAVLDFNAEVQRAIHHEHPRVLTETLMEEAYRLGFRSLNIDIGYGLPEQTPTRLRATLKQTIELNPARITLRGNNTAAAPALLQQSADQLIAAGYGRIGTDHFAQPTDSLALAAGQHTLQRSQQGYTTHGHCDLLGLGVTALSRIGDVYRHNHARLDDYAGALAAGPWRAFDA